MGIDDDDTEAIGATSGAGIPSYGDHMANNPTNKRSRHIGYRLQFVRDAVDYLQTRPHYVGTASQPADLLTKPGTAASLELHGDLLGGTGACPQTRQLFPGIGA